MVGNRQRADECERANGKDAGSGQGAREADKEAQLRRAPVGSWKQELPMTSCKATPARSTLRSDKDSQRSAWAAHRHEKGGHASLPVVTSRTLYVRYTTVRIFR